jgi:hypothetical protein
MKKSLLVLVFCCIWEIGFGQTNGDYRSATNGLWDQVSTWQVFNGGWQPLNSIAAGSFVNKIPNNSSGVITITHTVSANLNLLLINQTVIESGGRLNILSGKTVRVVDDFSQTPLQVDASGLLVNNGVLDLQSQLSATPCQINGFLASNGSVLSSNSSLLFFNSGATYQHSNRTGGSIPMATWHINSTCYIFGMFGSGASAPGNLNQPFGNFLWNTPSMVSSISLSGQLTTVNGNLLVINTGSPSRELLLDYNDGGPNLTIGGDLDMRGGTLTLSQNQTSATTVNIVGDLLMSGGTIRMGNSTHQPINLLINGNFQKTGGVITRGSGGGAGTIRFDGANQSFVSEGNITGAVNYAVENGSNLDLGTSALTGTGNFLLNSSAILQVKSTDAGGAIQLGTSGGNIQVGGTRSYAAGSTIIYNASAAQFMANGHPSSPNTIIDNTNNVSMVGNVTINGDLTLGDNNLLIESNTLTLGGDLIRTGGALGASTTSSLTVNGSGDFGDLVFIFTEAPNNPINNLTINRSGGTVYLGSSLIVAGAFTQTAGTFSLGQFSAYTLTLRGNFSQAVAASLAVFDNSSLVIEGAGTLPANVNILGPNLFSLTMNRPSRTFSSSSALTLTNLNLFNGVVSNTSLNIVMSDGGIVTRHSGGSITSVLGTVFPGATFDVIYNVDADISTGNELPFDLTRLGNLTKQGTALVTLTHPIQVNKTFTVAQGTFNIGDLNDVAIVEDLIVDGVLLSGESTVSFVGSAPQEIDATPALTLFDVELNQTVASTVNLTAGTFVDIQNSLAVNSASTLNAGNNQLRLLSTNTRTANVAPIASGASIVGSVAVQRFLPKAVERAEFFHMASPVTNANFTDWTDDLSISTVQRWNQPTAAYVNVGLNTAIVNGTGYVVDITTPQTDLVETHGTLQQGNVAVNITTQTPGVVGGSFGWNLIGNPYPSTIDWDNVTINETQVYNAIYMWDNFGNSGQGTGTGIIVSYVDDVGTPASFGGEIAPGQAFWVKALQNSSINFTESAKIPVTNTTVFRKKEIPNVLRIVINCEGVNDETVIRLREGATENFDGKYDAYKYLSTNFNISTLTNDKVKAVINAFGTSSCNRNIPIVAEGAKAGSFTLNFAGIESFDPSVTLALVDKLEQKSIDLRGQQVYSFAITSENLDKIGSRFQIAIGSNASTINNAITAKGENLCEDQEFAKILLESSEPGVEYIADWNGNKLSDPVMGTGSPIELMVRTGLLSMGENEVSVMAQQGVCSMTALTTKPVITRFKRGQVSSVIAGEICVAGSTTLRAAGADDEGWYLWYNSPGDVEPIAGQTTAEFATPHLTKSRTYYVAVVNTFGCEGARVPVQAIVSYPENVMLTTDNEGILVSNVQEGNQWYLNGVLLEGHTSNKLEPFQSGTYTVEIKNGGCRSSASLDVTGMEENGIAIFPNPAPDKVIIRIKTQNNNVVATLVSTQGIEIARSGFTSNGDVKETEFDLRPYTAGIYNVKILDGSKVIIRKIAKIK